jgi:asparagine N-glycosylation enzyme membrane subunit Stt3
MMPLGYASVFSSWALVCKAAGAAAAHYYMQGTGKQSIITLSMSLVIGLSVVFMGYEGVVRFRRDPASATAIGGLC